MEEMEKELNSVILAVARDLEDFISRVANKADPSEPEMMAMTRAAAVIPSLGFRRY